MDQLCIVTVMTATTEDWSEAVTAAAEPPTVEVKLFGKWNPDEVHVNDISLAVSVFFSLIIRQTTNMYVITLHYLCMYY